MENTAPKKRGRPLGAIREVYFMLAAIKNGELIHEQIQATRGEYISEDAMLEEVTESFIKKYNVEPLSSFGPFFEAKLSQYTQNKRIEIPKFNEELINLTNHVIQAEYNGWQVVGRYFIDEFGEKRDDYVKISFKKEIKPGDKQKAKPHETFKQVSELSNIVTIRET